MYEFNTLQKFYSFKEIIGFTSCLVITVYKLGTIVEKRLLITSVELVFWERRKTMLETVILILVVLWLLGSMTGMGGSLIHILLAVALVVLVIRVVTGRKVV